MLKFRAAVGFLILFSAFSLIIVFLLSFKTYPDGVLINNKLFVVEVADSVKLQEKGLSGHTPLLDNEGMLFVFNNPGEYGIWMKDMFFSIDIIWINENYRVVHTEEAVSPKTYPKVFYPGTNSLYVLELASGQINKAKIKNGDLVEFVKNSQRKLDF
ncbi:MAG TPA: DUF192 domain-containing protein [Candidatus Paceibacterota bacterium]